MQKGKLVHGSFQHIQSFKPLSHFGTRDAALEVVRNRFAANRIPAGAAQILFHHVEITLQNPVISQKDYGPPNPATCLLYLAHGQIELSAQKRHEFHMKHLRRLTEIGGGNLTIRSPKLEEMREYVTEVFSQTGYDGIIYTNEVEDRGNKSWVITDPSQVKLERIETIPIASLGGGGD